MNHKEFIIAAAQIDTSDHIEANLRKIEQMTEEASKNNAKLIVFPETSEYIGPSLKEHAQTIPGDTFLFFSNLAKKNNIYLHCGSITEKRKDQKCSNTSILFAPDGQQIGMYRKLHMFDVDVADGPCYKESDEIMAGEEIVICRTKLADFGLSICYDLRFPELFRVMTLNGAQVLFTPANFTAHTGEAHWQTLLRARAIENCCYVVAAGQTGKKPKYKAYGHSMIIDPWGSILVEADENECLIYATIDPERIKEIRDQIPCISNIRSDIYRLTSSKVHIYEEKCLPNNYL